MAGDREYDITLKPVYGALEAIPIAEAKKLSDHPWSPASRATSPRPRAARSS